MANKQKEQTKIDEKKRVDKVGTTNIYPVSEMEGASDDAIVHNEATLGQGKSGTSKSEVAADREINKTEKKIKTNG